MACQLPADCLNEIFEYLEMDKFTLYSCLLVNRLWCEISVRILWRNILNFKFVHKCSFKIESSILSTLSACLPNNSKKLLHDNNIFISTPTSKPLLFNYASFCKTLSIYGINRIIINALSNGLSLNSKDRNSLVANEIIKMFANQISSLKNLTYHHRYFYNLNISFPHFPGARDLSELCCNSDLPSDFFYQLSQICHNLQSITIDFCKIITNELKELISSQNNLKNLNLSASEGNWTDIIPTITKHFNTITKLNLYSCNNNSSFSFVSSFSNLQELMISFLNGELEDLKNLQYVNFPKLQILKFPFYDCLNPDYLMKFLENNGKNLKKLYIGECNKDLSFSIAKLCPNLKSLFIIFINGELDALKNILTSCQYLESIKIWCGKAHLSEKEVFETVAKYSPNNFCELKIHHITNSDVSPNDLELFFVDWEKRTSKKLLSFIIIDNNKEYCYNYEALEVIKKYNDLGTIEFVIKNEEEESEIEEEYYNFN